MNLQVGPKPYTLRIPIDPGKGTLKGALITTRIPSPTPGQELFARLNDSVGVAGALRVIIEAHLLEAYFWGLNNYLYYFWVPSYPYSI